MAYTPIPVTDLTAGTLSGDGVFDALIRAIKAHLDEEYQKNRIRGPEYSTVYLGSLQAVLQQSMAFLLERQKGNLEAQLLEKQVEIAELQRQTAQVQLAIAQASLPKVAAEIAQIEAQTALVNQQTANAVIEGTVLVARECLLRAEYDVALLTKLKVTAETDLLNQKKVTETAQVSDANTAPGSVIGRQSALYLAQSEGFKRDAEQKAAKLMIDSWNVRRTTDEATSANTTNKLDDASVGRVVDKLLTGVGA